MNRKNYMLQLLNFDCMYNSNEMHVLNDEMVIAVV